MTKRHHRPTLKRVAVVKQLAEEPQDDPDIIAVSGYVLVGEDLDGHWVGGFIRGCAKLSEEARREVISHLMVEGEVQIRELRMR